MKVVIVLQRMQSSVAENDFTLLACHGYDVLLRAPRFCGFKSIGNMFGINVQWIVDRRRVDQQRVRMKNFLFLNGARN